MKEVKELFLSSAKNKKDTETINKMFNRFFKEEIKHNLDIQDIDKKKFTDLLKIILGEWQRN